MRSCDNHRAEPDGFQQTCPQQTGFGDLQPLDEPSAGGHQLGGGFRVDLAFRRIADERGQPRLKPILRQRDLAVETAQARLPEGLVDHEQANRSYGLPSRGN